MDKIVTEGLKIDLHIHSEHSRNKDGDKVKNNTLSNLPILIDKLNDYGIGMCSVTDHDCFNYDIVNLRTLMLEIMDVMIKHSHKR